MPYSVASSFGWFAVLDSETYQTMAKVDLEYGRNGYVMVSPVREQLEADILKAMNALCDELNRRELDNAENND